MTAAERQARARHVRVTSYAGEVELSRQGIADAIRMLASIERGTAACTLADVVDVLSQARLHADIVLALMLNRADQ